MVSAGQNTPDFIRKDEWPPNSPDLNPLDFHVWGAILQRYQQRVPKPQNVVDLREVLKTIWNDLPQDSIQKAILAFRKRLKTCIEAEDGHFEPSKRKMDTLNIFFSHSPDSCTVCHAKIGPFQGTKSVLFRVTKLTE